MTHFSVEKYAPLDGQNLNMVAYIYSAENEYSASTGLCCRGIAEIWGKSGANPVLSRNGKGTTPEPECPPVRTVEQPFASKGKTSGAHHALQVL